MGAGGVAQCLASYMRTWIHPWVGGKHRKGKMVLCRTHIENPKE
jgi:hypothetical protein